MSKSFHENDRYPHKPAALKDVFCVVEYFERFDHIIDEKKYNKNTDIKNIMHMLEEVQPHFGDSAFKPGSFLRLLRELEKLKNRCPTFSADLSIFLKAHLNFENDLLQHACDKIKGFEKDDLFAFLMLLKRLSIHVTPNHADILFSELFIYINSFNGSDFCESIKIVEFLNSPPNTKWQKEWITACQSHLQELNMNQLTYIYDHINIFDKEIIKIFTYQFALIKTPLSKKKA